MKIPPLVSIIIPAYNRAHLIGETLDSVIAQTYQHWECIVVDDHSTDNTWEVVEDYCRRDARIKLLRRPEDRPKGANACRNYGFEISKGDYIQWLDSDDLLAPDKVTKQLNMLFQNAPLAVVAISQSIKFVNHANAIKTIGLFSEEIEPQNDIFKALVFDEIRWHTSAPLWSRSGLGESLFDEDLGAAQEWLFHIEQAMRLSQEKFIFDKTLVGSFIRADNSSISRTYDISRYVDYAKARIKLINKIESERVNILFIHRIISSIRRYIRKIIERKPEKHDVISSYEKILFTYQKKEWIKFIISRLMYNFFGIKILFLR